MAYSKFYTSCHSRTIQNIISYINDLINMSVCDKCIHLSFFQMIYHVEYFTTNNYIMSYFPPPITLYVQRDEGKEKLLPER